jgi:hypothetical protein
MPVGIRLLQIGRILGEDPATLDAARARELVASRPAEFAHALFLEAADSDDVTSIEDARVYLEARISFFGDLVESSAAAAIRAEFERLIAGWE